MSKIINDVDDVDNSSDDDELVLTNLPIIY